MIYSLHLFSLYTHIDYFKDGNQGNYREIALTYICSHATYGTSHGSANAKNFVNTGRFSSMFLIVEDKANYVKFRQCYSTVICFIFL